MTDDRPLCAVPFRLEVRRPLADVVVLEVAGEIDLCTAPRLWTVVQEQMAGRPRVIVLDLHQVWFLGASGVAVLMTARELAARLGVVLRLARPSRPVARPLALLRLDATFDVRHDLASAIDPPQSCEARGDDVPGHGRGVACPARQW